ncbi:hypothetical protein LJ754_10005 [Arthrobacter sp. zg-Y40]|uniref:hypothetical protein n=1 Tax=Arthrobacter sp. zg-Y40 TaxID=2886939 RepID=UPI001D14D26F|nr:hypothetical protein [Arthrobacter sp. zg-Y40]MCC3279487.1 hypothetical protein [Arthrobacter sp. zg-Y40]
MSTIDVLLGSETLDDAGARTADLYDWQAAMAAAEGMAALNQHFVGTGEFADLKGVRIVCEVHEDWILQIGSAVELVSAKHREQSTGPFLSIAVLVDAGGLGHLFERWLNLGKNVAVRLVSCAAVAPDVGKALADCTRLLRRKADGDALTTSEADLLGSHIQTFGQAIMMYRKNLPSAWQAPLKTRSRQLVVPDDLAETVGQFILVLTIDSNRPNRELVHHSAPSLYALPLLRNMGIQSASTAVAVWYAVLAVFRVRMRARGPRANGNLPDLGGVANQGSFPTSLFEERIVTLEDVLTAVNTAINNPSAYTPIPTHTRITQLGVKMAQGGCSDTSIELAERLKLDYSRYRRERRNSVPGARAEERVLENRLLRIADRETTRVRVPGETYGDKLWSALSERLDDATKAEERAGLEGDIALGGICDLTSRCLVWFGPRFDVKAAVAAAKSIRTGGIT